MDSAPKSKRMFPAYTTAQLKQRVAEIKATQVGIDACMMVVALQDEIGRREAGISTITVIPQIRAFK